jgi:hypothetical protein
MDVSGLLDHSLLAPGTSLPLPLVVNLTNDINVFLHRSSRYVTIPMIALTVREEGLTPVIRPELLEKVWRRLERDVHRISEGLETPARR